MSYKFFIKTVILFLLYRDKINGHVHHQRDSQNLDRIVDALGHQSAREYTPAPHKLKHYKDVCTEDDAICVLPVQCPAHVKSEKVNYCMVIGGRKGICCVSGQNHTGNFILTKISKQN